MTESQLKELLRLQEGAFYAALIMNLNDATKINLVISKYIEYREKGAHLPLQKQREGR
jgi:hypothetical protein